MVLTNVPDYWPFSILRSGSIRERIIVDLDYGGRDEALHLVDLLATNVGMFKVGRHLFLQTGPELVREIRRRHGEIFLDLRFHDTSRLLSSAIAQATRMGVKMFDLHPGYPPEGMERTRSEINRLCQHEGLRRPYLLGVAMHLRLVRSQAQRRQADEQHLVRLSRAAAVGALDGVMTQLENAERVRAACGRRFFIVTSAGMHEDNREQARAVAAVSAGANFLVVGRQIWEAKDPLAAVHELSIEMERALRSISREYALPQAERLPSDP